MDAYRRAVWCSFVAGLAIVYSHVVNVEANAKAEAEPTALRDEAPHLELRARPSNVMPGEIVTVEGRLRGYRLGSSDFCLEPTWTIYGTNAGGNRAGIEVEIPCDKVQCRDHAFKCEIRFTNAAVYGVELALRTKGTARRIAERKRIYVVIGGSK